MCFLKPFWFKFLLFLPHRVQFLTAAPSDLWSPTSQSLQRSSILNPGSLVPNSHFRGTPPLENPSVFCVRPPRERFTFHHITSLAQSPISQRGSENDIYIRWAVASCVTVASALKPFRTKKKILLLSQFLLSRVGWVTGGRDGCPSLSWALVVEVALAAVAGCSAP